MSFQAHDVTFREVITIHGANYFIPRFQRAYSWNTDNAEDFYGDMKEEQDEFFAGSIALLPSKKLDLFWTNKSIETKGVCLIISLKIVSLGFLVIIKIIQILK